MLGRSPSRGRPPPSRGKLPPSRGIPPPSRGRPISGGRLPSGGRSPFGGRPNSEADTPPLEVDLFPLETDPRVLTVAVGMHHGWFAFLLEITSELRKSKKCHTYIMKSVRPKCLQENSCLEQVHLGQLFRKKQPVLRCFFNLITVGNA